MNLISCYENCIYQRDGYCKMGTTSPISAIKVNGCNYYHPKKKSKQKTVKEKYNIIQKLF